MAIIQLILSLIVLGFIYIRMIRREVPEQIGKAQSVTPVFLGISSLPLSVMFFVANVKILPILGYDPTKLSKGAHSVCSALFSAGLPEEFAKLIMMIAALIVFRSKIRNVYEYIMIGAAIGFGFTLFEEFAYGSGQIISTAGRLITIAGHMIFGMIMARHLAMAKYKRVKGKGSAFGEYILAFLIPVAIHTLYDACTARNFFLLSGDDRSATPGMILGMIGLVVLFVLQIIVPVRFKKNTEKYCSMTFNS